jgi:hypothetical protein
MRAAGFELSRVDGHIEPGTWIAMATVDGAEVAVPVDLIVPEAAAPSGGRRAARLGVHGRRAARRATGLEAALVDHSAMQITALDPNDTRVVQARVAGEAALFVAKAHKIHDRQLGGRLDRINDKDAADVVRLMQTTDPSSVGSTIAGFGLPPIRLRAQYLPTASRFSMSCSAASDVLASIWLRARYGLRCPRRRSKRCA